MGSWKGYHRPIGSTVRPAVDGTRLSDSIRRCAKSAYNGVSAWEAARAATYRRPSARGS